MLETAGRTCNRRGSVKNTANARNRKTWRSTRKTDQQDNGN